MNCTKLLLLIVFIACSSLEKGKKKLLKRKLLSSLFLGLTPNAYHLFSLTLQYLLVWWFEGCVVSLKDRKCSDELLSRLFGHWMCWEQDPESEVEMVRHVEQKEENDWVKKCTRMNVTGVMGRGAPRKTWSCVKRDMKTMGIKRGNGAGPMLLGGILLAWMPNIPC